jgi:glutaredoxin 2
MTYEIKLKLDDSHKPLTEYMISENWAEKATENSKCLIYPSFNILETADFYPTFGEREYLMKKFNIDFNKFEEENIDKSISQVNDLMMALKKLFKTRQDVYEGFYFLLQGTV